MGLPQGESFSKVSTRWVQKCRRGRGHAINLSRSRGGQAVMPAGWRFLVGVGRVLLRTVSSPPKGTQRSVCAHGAWGSH